MGLGVRGPTEILFYYVKFSFFYFGVLGVTKVWKFSLGFRPKFEKNRGFACRREGVLPAAQAGCGARHSRWAKPLRGDRQNPHFFQILDGTPKKIFKILGLPLTPKS